MIIPKISELEYISEKEINQEITRRKNSFLYDYDKQEFIKEGSKFRKSSNIDSVRDWIQRNTLTLLDTWGVLKKYNSEFGSLFQGMIGESFDPTYTETMIKKECKTRFEKHPEIVSIENVNVKFSDTGAYISYTALLLDDITMEGEVYF